MLFAASTSPAVDAPISLPTRSPPRFLPQSAELAQLVKDRSGLGVCAKGNIQQYLDGGVDVAAGLVSAAAALRRLASAASSNVSARLRQLHDRAA